MNRTTLIAAAAFTGAAIAGFAGAQGDKPLEPAAVLTGHTGTVTVARFAPDGTRVVTAGSDANLRLWGADGTAGATLNGHTGVVWTADWSPDGKHLLSGGRDGTARLWNAADGASLQVMNHGRPGAVMRVRYVTPELACLQGGNRTPQLWQVAKGSKAGDLVGHADVVWGFAAAQGRWLVSGGQDRTARLWDLQNGRTSRVFGRDAMQAPDGGHAGTGSPVFAVSIAPDAMLAATGHREGQVKLWSTPDEKLVGPRRSHSGAVLVVRFSPDGKWLLTGSADRTVGLWNVQAKEGEQAGKRLGGCTDWVQALDVSPDGTKVAAGDWKGNVRFWSIPSGRSLGAGSGHSGRITSVHFSPDGTKCVTASGDGTARIWDVP